MTFSLNLKSMRASLVGVAFVAGLALSAAPAAASTISGSINISGAVNNPTSTTGVDFEGSGFTTAAGLGDLSGIAGGTSVALTDVVFASLPGNVWSVGGFSFSLTSLISAAVANGSGGINFVANGVLSAAGFEDTLGVFAFSSNSITGAQASFSSTTAVPVPPALLLFGSGIAGLGLLASRRRNKANAGSVSAA